MRFDRHQLNDALRSPRVRAWLAVALVLALAAGVWALWPQIHRKPPSIFDTPVDGVLSYLGTDDFNRLSVKERMEFIAGILERFRSMSQSDSAVASAFFAGLAGPANEKLIENARVLGKDIIVQGASEFLTLPSQAERDAFIDRWIIDWVRFSEQTTGRSAGATDEQILTRMSEQARRDARRAGDINSAMMQQIIDFWDRDVASVASPREQAQIYQFAPAIRQRLLSRQ